MPFSSTPASSAGGTAQLRSRGRSPKIARLVHYTLHTVAWAAGGMRGLCMRACVLVLEMPFSITFSAAVGVAERLRGWDVAQKLARLALSNVAERGIDSRGHALAVGPLQGALISAHLV